MAPERVVLMRLHTSSVAVFVVRPAAAGGHEFLQLRRGIGTGFDETWQTVRGGIEPGETAWQAAIRELREETRLIPTEFYRLGSCETFYFPRPDDDAIWVCPAFCAIVSADAEPTLNAEHDAARWVPRGRTSTAFVWASEKPILEEISREILDDGPCRPYLRVDLLPTEL